MKKYQDEQDPLSGVDHEESNGVQSSVLIVITTIKKRDELSVFHEFRPIEELTNAWLGDGSDFGL